MKTIQLNMPDEVYELYETIARRDRFESVEQAIIVMLSSAAYWALYGPQSEEDCNSSH